MSTEVTPASVPQHVLGRVRTESVDVTAAAAGSRDLDALTDRSSAVGVHFERDPVSNQSLIPSDLQRFDLGNLLHEHRNPHWIPFTMR